MEALIKSDMKASEVLEKMLFNYLENVIAFAKEERIKKEKEIERLVIAFAKYLTKAQNENWSFSEVSFVDMFRTIGIKRKETIDYILLGLSIILIDRWDRGVIAVVGERVLNELLKKYRRHKVKESCDERKTFYVDGQRLARKDINEKHVRLEIERKNLYINVDGRCFNFSA